MRLSNVLVAASLLNGLALAIPWIEPLPTPQGLLDAAGVSPRPTEAPGANGIPIELRKRKQNILYPPPDNWCGFIEGDYSELATALLSLRVLTRPHRQSFDLLVVSYLR